MPWCEDCSRFYTPSTLTATGDCPEGHHVPAPSHAPTEIRQSSAEPRERESVKAPWHFWVLVASVVIYLGWRLIQGIGILVG